MNLFESAKRSAKIEDLAKARAAAGEAGELETATATADTLQVREQLARPRHDSKVAREPLNNLVSFGLETFSGQINVIARGAN